MPGDTYVEREPESQVVPTSDEYEGDYESQMVQVCTFLRSYFLPI